MTDQQKVRRYERALRLICASLFPVDGDYDCDAQEIERRAKDAYWIAFTAVDQKRAKAARSGK